LSGKIVVAVAGIVMSSASAATVGIVYEGILSFRHDATVAPAVEGGIVGPSKGAVVLNSAESVFDTVKDALSGTEDTICPGLAGSKGCVLVPSSKDVRVKIFGHDVTIPVTWPGLDGEDEYSAVPAMWSRIGLLNQDIQFVLNGRRGVAETGGTQTSDDSSSASGPQSAQAAGVVLTMTQIGSGGVVGWPVDLGSLVPATPLIDAVGAVIPELPSPEITDASPGDPFVSGSAEILPPTSPPGLDQQGGAIPEPSTWAMIVGGFGGLALLHRRRSKGGLSGA
jgi:hypothetical protein